MSEDLKCVTVGHRPNWGGFPKLQHTYSAT